MFRGYKFASRRCTVHAYHSNTYLDASKTVFNEKQIIAVITETGSKNTEKLLLVFLPTAYEANKDNSTAIHEHSPFIDHKL